ncbi:MAG: hypothetical protein ABIG84_04905 [archaeon]
MDNVLLFLVILLYAVVAYLIYTKMKMRSLILELEYTVEELHKKIVDYEGLHAKKAMEKRKKN